MNSTEPPVVGLDAPPPPAPTEYALLATWRWTRTLHAFRTDNPRLTRCGRPVAAYVTAATATAVLGARLAGAVCAACRKGAES